jgi:hypothetical protein
LASADWPLCTIGEGALPGKHTIASLCHLYLSNLHTLTVAFDGGLKEQRALEARVDHAVDLVLNGVRLK